MTPIRKILLPLNGTETGKAALATALLVARQFHAHVVALHVSADAREIAPLAGEGLSGAMVEEMMTAAERESGQRSRQVRRSFEEFVTAHSVTVAEARDRAPDEASAALATMTGREEDIVAQSARLSDLVVVPHPDAADLSSSDALHAVLFDSGRPVLIAPKLEPATLGTRVAIAWNGSAESAAAVLACMPWLNRADAVCVLHADQYQRRGPLARELLAYLRLHDVKAELAPFAPIERDVGAGLLAAARTFGADLMCQGAYSHSRLRQLILGGVTRYTLERADLPVLMCR